MHSSKSRSTFAAVVALLVGLLSLGFAQDAEAQKKTKSVQTEAKWVSFDAETRQVTVRVVKAGKIKDKKLKKAFKKGKDVTFDVKPGGSVLTKTTVALNGVKGELTDIDEGKRVNIYWVTDAEKETGRFARKIDVVMSEEELNERYGFKD